MSASWMGYFFDNTDLDGSLLLLALAIADHADANGRCGPGTAILAKKIRKQERQTKALIKQLEQLGHVEVNRGSGRGHKSGYQLKKVQPTAPFSSAEKVQSSAPFMTEERVQPVTPFLEEKVQPSAPFTENKGCNFDAERVQFPCTPLKEEPFKPFSLGSAAIADDLAPSRPANGARSKPDERKDHAAIRALRDVTGRYPHKLLWDDLIAALGDEPNVERLRNCLTRWVGRGYNPLNFAWALDWYREGIPAHVTAPAASSNGNGKARAVDTFAFDDSPPAPERVYKPRRPADDSPPEHQALWRSFRDQLRKSIDPAFFEQWFGPVLFDGLNADKTALKVRGDPITVDWISRTYSKQIYNALIAAGLGGFTLEWEIEEPEYEEIMIA